MQTNLSVFETYFQGVGAEKHTELMHLAEVISNHIPIGFEPQIQYNMPSWVVPLSYYPAGYHCKSNTPLPFISIAAQKNHLALYHMGLYAHLPLFDWFIAELKAATDKQPDIGKSCIRFKYGSDIPFSLIGQLCGKMSPATWIEIYETSIRK
jgi:uncharacterized protein YdhG (YjbR/CyaY superfamily)